MRILIQAGHEGRTTGATGAPGEQAFNKDTANRVADALRAKGVEVKRVNADPTDAEIAGDWDLFLTIHYDADVYNADGGFVDFPEPSTDGATVKSQAIAKALTEEFFPTTGIRNVPSRSNANTRFYYMWKRISAKTPCVIIECGVGNRQPKDNDPLNTNRQLAVNGIMKGLTKALNLAGEPMPNNLLTYLGVANETDAKARLEIHLGQLNDKSEWGNEEGDRGGFLGAARRDTKRLQAQVTAMQAELDGVPGRIQLAKQAGYDEGFAAGQAANPTPPSTDPTQPVGSVDMSKYVDNGVTIETTEGNTKTIVNYKKVV